MSDLKYNPETTETKQRLLDETRATLKKEFIGIDTVIDSVIDSLTTWFLFPELQERPQVINLWGMTGVGKTALVLRISALLNYEKKLFRYDMGNSSHEKLSLKDRLASLFSNNNSEPYILMMDEFQYAKTKNESDEEIDNPYSRVLWDLLDSGKFQNYKNAETDIEQLVQIKDMLQQCLADGVKVKNGVVVENVRAFLDILNQDRCYGEIDFQNPVESDVSMDEEKTTYHFLGLFIIQDLFKYMPRRTQSMAQFKQMIYKMDGAESISLVEKVIEYAKCNTWIDCTKALVFILGNLDDAYRMSSSFNPDIDADDFHEMSKHISINHIKRALKKRFRSEQIARLGNNHIIYPAFSRHSFEKLINLELQKAASTYFDKFGVRLSFSDKYC